MARTRSRRTGRSHSLPAAHIRLSVGGPSVARTRTGTVCKRVLSRKIHKFSAAAPPSSALAALPPERGTFLRDLPSGLFRKVSRFDPAFSGLLYRGALAAASVLVSLVLLEMALRVADYDLNRHPHWRYSPSLGWVVDPEESTMDRVQPSGFRHDPLPEKKAPGTKRLLVLVHL